MNSVLNFATQLTWDWVFLFYALVFIASWHISAKLNAGRYFDVLTNPLIYLQLIMFTAFPLRGWLLETGIVYAQTNASFSHSSLAASCILTLGMELIIIGGFYSVRKLSPLKISNEDIQMNIFFNRLLWINLFLIVTTPVFFLWVSVKDGQAFAMSGMQQFEARLGNGPYYMLMVFSYNYIFCLFAALIHGWEKLSKSKSGKLLTSIILIGFPIQVFSMIILLSRRDVAAIAALTFMAIAILIAKKGKSSLSIILLVAVISGTFLASPFLDYCRNVVAPSLFSKRISPVADLGNNDIALPDFSAHTILDDQAYWKLHDLIKENRVSFLSLSSSFEGADHLARFLETRTPQEFWTGSDYGEAWLYNIGLSFVPRLIWKEKPLVYGNDKLQFELYPQYEKFGYAAPRTPLTFTVDFMNGFGIIGAIILCFLCGRFFAVTWQYWRQSNAIIPTAFFLYVFLNLFNFVRGGTPIIPVYGVFLITTGICFGFKASASLGLDILKSVFAIQSRK